ncbi:ribosome biogenesis protein [Grosmannia clavigera kw1407]|uniref:Ribosome biogenesis protein n=1 Tax=Grosmannia clavigera (strain kw1407 / UAMH 11150) TaxID=655863 RepID=F0XPM4_GROCL|nr:ribosome biogenesis protein [Grosmannia clavigera kw1407]EFX00176.1 ribosome biogenesis protein [Grosmannia clavigera kw1407]
MAKSVTQKRRREAEADQERRHDSEATGEDAPTTAPPSKKARVEERRSVFVRSLPSTATSEKLTEFFSEHFPVKHATVVTDPKTKESRGYGFVTFTDAEDAKAAKEKLDNGLFDGRRLRLDIAEPRHRPSASGSGKGGGGAAGAAAIATKKKREEDLAEARKAPKLIVRNLPWSIKTSEDLTNLFRMHGKVKFADLPQSKGKMSGFGFVTLRGRKNAENAIAAINGKTVDGRTLAVDWAVDKQTWDQQQLKEGNTSAEMTEKAEKKEKREGKGEKKEEKKEEKKGEKKEEEEEEDEDMRNFMKNVLHTLEDEEESDKEEDEEDEEKDEDEEDEDEEEEDEEDEEAGDDWEDEGSQKDEEDKEKEAPKKTFTTDNSTTLFIRNLPFTTSDEALKTHFSQFGAVRYARIVMDRATDRPAGTGFVCFFDGEVAQDCVRAAPRAAPASAAAASAAALGKRSVLQDERVDRDGRYTLDGRVLQVAQAVSKTEATQLATEGPGAQRVREKDKRRLFLLSEGTIAAGTPQHALLPPNEVQMREQSAKQRAAMVKSNPSLHLSLTRLAVRNIPRHIDSKGLKELARRAVVGFATDVKAGLREPLSREELSRGGQLDREAEQRRRAKGVGVVRQAKVVFESEQGSKVAESGSKNGKNSKTKDGEAAPVGRSRGYGFIEYWSHRWALTGLRWLNGHPVKSQDGAKTNRLIVEFAIENANVVARRKANEERSRNPRPRTEEGVEANGVDAAKGKFTGPGRDRKRDGKDGKDKTKNKAAQAAQSTRIHKAADEPKDADLVKPSKKQRTDAKLAMRQQIIGRKRLMRKKKGMARSG